MAIPLDYKIKWDFKGTDTESLLDKSGNGYNLVKNVGASEPIRLNTHGEYDTYALTDGTSFTATTPYFKEGESFTLFFVAKHDTPTTPVLGIGWTFIYINGQLAFNVSGETGYLSASKLFDVADTAGFSYPNSGVESYYKMCVTYDATTKKLTFKDNGSIIGIFENVTVTTGVSNAIVIQGNANEPKISHFLIYDRVLTNEEINTLNTSWYEDTPKLANPTFSPPTGFEFSDLMELEISASLIPDVGYPWIYATTDGSTPDENSIYVGADPGQTYVWLTQTCTVKAIAILQGYESSDVVEANYVKLPNSQKPTITPAAGTYSEATTVTITAPAGPEVTVFYTTDGSTPTYDSPSFTGTKEIEVSDNITIKAFALQNGYSSSELVTNEYIINKGGSTMDVGLPKLDIIFKGLGVSAVARGSKGVAILIIKDDTNKTFDFVTYRSYADLTSTESAKYTADNLQYIKDALDGTPLKLIVARMDVAGTLADMLVKIRGIAPRNCWIGMAAGATVDHDAIVSWVKSERTNNKKCYKAVVFNATAPDSLAIVNFVNTSVVFADARSTKTGEKGIATLLGFFAGLPLTMSGIGKPLSYKFSSVIEPADNEAAVNAGKLVLYSEDGAVKVARAINSLQTTGQDVTDDMKFIIIVEAMDMIFTDIYETWNNYFKGKYKNFMTNQLLLIGAINSYFTGLANDLILDPLYENKSAIDTEKQRLANIPKYGEDVVNAWDDNKVMLMTVGTNVYLKANVKILNAFEDMALSIYM